MSSDPQVKAWLQGLEDSGLPPLDEMSVADARATFEAVVNDCGIKPEPVANITDRTIPGPGGDIPIRIYTPEGGGVFPIIVYFHGGGWVIGNLEVVHGPCTLLANRAQAVVVSVDYRKGPEHPFPAAVDDAFAATKWVADSASLLSGDSQRIAVAGDSAGGNLSAVVALMARDAGYPQVTYQMLFYPATDAARETASYRENSEGHFLTGNLIKWFGQHYLGDDADVTDWRISPLLVADVTGVAPAHVITAEFDPLRDEGEAYAERLREAGIMATVERYDGQIHGFSASLAGVMDQGRKSLEDAGQKLRDALQAGREA